MFGGLNNCYSGVVSTWVSFCWNTFSTDPFFYFFGPNKVPELAQLSCHNGQCLHGLETWT